MLSSTDVVTIADCTHVGSATASFEEDLVTLHLGRGAAMASFEHATVNQEQELHKPDS